MKNKYGIPLIALFICCFLQYNCTRNNETLPQRHQELSQNLVDNSGRQQANPEVAGKLSGISGIVPREDGSIEYRFSQLQRLHLLLPDNPGFESIKSMLREAWETGVPVHVFSEGNDILSHINWPTEAEILSFKNWNKNKLTGLQSLAHLNMLVIPPGFDKVENQNWDVFKKCSKIVPDMSIANDIFNFCAAQGCVNGTPQVSPCISFQYVNNGCYARAHKMRYIIENIFRYCSEKVFSYYSLSVKAVKWGGCCINWWFHVAPLIRVRTNSGILCYVIDPSMFNGPVLLSTWLRAQKDISCNERIDPTITYAIVPSAAYLPGPYNAFNGSFEYLYDDNYIDTDRTLTGIATTPTDCISYR
jgi:Glutaminase